MPEWWKLSFGQRWSATTSLGVIDIRHKKDHRGRFRWVATDENNDIITTAATDKECRAQVDAILAWRAMRKIK